MVRKFLRGIRRSVLVGCWIMKAKTALVKAEHDRKEF